MMNYQKSLKIEMNYQIRLGGIYTLYPCLSCAQKKNCMYEDSDSEQEHRVDVPVKRIKLSTKPKEVLDTPVVIESYLGG